MQWLHRTRFLQPLTVCLLSVSVTAQTGLSVAGYITDETTRERLQGVSLELKSATGQAAATPVFSGISGEFRFGDLRDGDYSLQARKAGYEPAKLDIMLRGSSRSNVLFFMNKMRAPGAAKATEPVSIHQLGVPEKARTLFENGLSLLNMKQDYRGALAQFQRAIEQYPGYYEAYGQSGVAYYHLGDMPAAEQALRKSVSLSAGQYPEALFLLAAMLNDLERFVEAEPFALQAILLEDGSWRGYFELARTQAGLKRPAEAQPNALKALALNSHNPQTYLVLSNIHLQQRQFAAVLQDFDAYLKLQPAGPQSDAIRKRRQQLDSALQKARAQPTASPPGGG